eukprot:m.33578 g.33578  ORF g.33578 m.33578 type:complete len:206 (-) comp10902_c0_seq2:54-671(-)
MQREAGSAAKTRRTKRRDRRDDRPTKKGQKSDADLLDEEDSSAFQLVFPDGIKQRLTDDAEKIKAKKLVKLPSSPTVSEIVKDYLSTIDVTSAKYQVAAEVVAGLKVYFQHCLSSILLYKFEEQQFESTVGDKANGEVNDVYGGIHLLRLFVKLPALLVQTDMNAQALSVLLNCLQEIMNHVEAHLDRLIPMKYVEASADYKKKA